jgi:hypothetical protein
MKIYVVKYTSIREKIWFNPTLRLIKQGVCRIKTNQGLRELYKTHDAEADIKRKNIGAV